MQSAEPRTVVFIPICTLMFSFMSQIVMVLFWVIFKDFSKPNQNVRIQSCNVHFFFLNFFKDCWEYRIIFDGSLCTLYYYFAQHTQGSESPFLRQEVSEPLKNVLQTQKTGF